MAVIYAVLMTASFAAHAQSFQPCGGSSGKLWSWAWAGNGGSNVTLNSNNFGTEVSYMGDLSGNGNDYFNDDPFNQDPPTRPAYRSSFSLNGYSTSHPIVGADVYDSGDNAYLQYMFQPNDMVAPGEFYLAFAGYESRSGGQRMIWGTTGNNFVRYDQLEHRIDIRISGASAFLTDKDSWSNGPILIEVWRDGANNLHTWINGAPKTYGNPSLSGNFALNGIGGGEPSGNGAFDDYGFEYIACDGLPTPTQRQEIREYMRSKWGLYGSISNPPVAPAAPMNLTAE